MDKEMLKELKSFVSSEIETKVADRTSELSTELGKANTELTKAATVIESLQSQIEELKSTAAEGHLEVNEKPEERWATYYKNMFYAVNPQNQVLIRGRDGGERQLVITPQKRVEALEALEKISGNEIQKAALAEGADATGGYVVPTPQDLISEVIRLAEPASIALRECRRYPMRSLTLPLTTAANGVTVAWTDEAGAIGEVEPTFGRTTLTAKKLAAYSKISNELLADADTSIVSYLNELFAEAIGLELDEQLFNGNTATSTNAFTGLFLKANVVNVTMGTGAATDSFDALTGDHLSTMISKLNSVKLAGANFYMHRTVEHYVRVLKDTNSNYLYHPYRGIGTTAGSGGSAWGIPVVPAEKCPSTSAASTAFVLLGNLRRVWLGVRQDMMMSLDPYGLFTNDQTRLRVTSRWAIANPLPTAFVKLTTGATS